MRWHNYFVNGKVLSVLEICEMDDSELYQASALHETVRNLEISLSSLEHLSLFKKIETLILTGGIPTQAGLDALYHCVDIENLVLFYEETDSDEDGIHLDRLLKLKYVLSLSNLNIYHLDAAPKEKTIEVLNQYCNSKCIHRSYSGTDSPLRIPRAFFFSVEAESPTAVPLMEILNRFERVLDNGMRNRRYSDRLDRIAMVPICMSSAMHNQGFGKERRYVSLKKREADIRLKIDYDSFVISPIEVRIQLCKECILRGAAYIEKKDPSFCLNLLKEDIETVPG